MTMFWLCPATITVACACLGLLPALPSKAEDKAIQIQTDGALLQNGWEQVIEIPAVEGRLGKTFVRSAKVTLWVEQDWLSVRQNDADGAVEWQVALAQPIQDALLVVDVDKATAGLGLSYGKYFIRENIQWLRVFRQMKELDSPPWPKLDEPLPPAGGSASSFGGRYQIRGCRHNDWRWALSGLSGGRYDVWLRLEREGLAKDRGDGFVSGFSGGKPVEIFYGDKYALDEETFSMPGVRRLISPRELWRC